MNAERVYLFRHAVLRDAAYQLQLPGDRMRLHALALGAIEELLGTTEHCVMWLEHLLLHSMLQHRSGAWSWGRYVVVRHDANPDVADLLERYHDLLADDTTFSTVTLSELRGKRVVLWFYPKADTPG